ncbi:MAG TPA: hypothetical protein VH723_05390 [Candidatus Limnocylindrales bacterium]
MAERTPAAPTPGGSREGLMARWRDARRKRDAAKLGSDAYRGALEELARIEVEIARLERAMDPPRM